jgi:hypothetical protein
VRTGGIKGAERHAGQFQPVDRIFGPSFISVFFNRLALAAGAYVARQRGNTGFNGNLHPGFVIFLSSLCETSLPNSCKFKAGRMKSSDPATI